MNALKSLVFMTFPTQGANPILVGAKVIGSFSKSVLNAAPGPAITHLGFKPMQRRNHAES